MWKGKRIEVNNQPFEIRRKRKECGQGLEKGSKKRHEYGRGDREERQKAIKDARRN